MKNKKQIQKTLLRTKIKRLMIIGGLAVLVAAPLLLGNGAMHKVNAAQGDVQINETNFPDAEFRRYISDKIDLNKDGVLSKAEIKKIKEIHIDNDDYTCKSLDGIGVFTELKTLECSGQKDLSKLDLDKNKKLEVVECSFCRMKELNVSGAVNLKKLHCSDNKLTNLDLIENHNLEYLYCANNKLTKLSFEKNKKLKGLNCDQNMLTQLDISHNNALTWVSCEKNKITNLDLRNNLILGGLYCDFNNLTQLDISKNKKLENVTCSYNKITKLDISNNVWLFKLDCSNNKLTKLDTTHNNGLLFVNCSNNKIKKLDFSANPMIDQVSLEGNKLTEVIVPRKADVFINAKKEVIKKKKEIVKKGSCIILWDEGGPYGYYTVTSVKKNGGTAKLIKANEYYLNRLTNDLIIGSCKFKITEIGSKAYYNCKFFEDEINVIISNSVKKIGSKAFAGTKCLKTITLGKSVEEIGANAFANSKDLKVLKIKSTKLTSKNLDKKAFAGITAKTTIKVPKSKLSTYKKLFRKCGLNKNVKIKAI